MSLVRKNTNAVSMVVDQDADNTIAQNGLVYVVVDNFLVLGVTFSAEFQENGERGEVWGGCQAVEGDVWVEVEDVSDINVVEVYNEEWGDELPLECFEMTDSDAEMLKNVIINLIEGVEPTTTIANDYYFA